MKMNYNVEKLDVIFVSPPSTIKCFLPMQSTCKGQKAILDMQISRFSNLTAVRGNPSQSVPKKLVKIRGILANDERLRRFVKKDRYVHLGYAN